MPFHLFVEEELETRFLEATIHTSIQTRHPDSAMSGNWRRTTWCSLVLLIAISNAWFSEATDIEGFVEFHNVKCPDDVAFKVKTGINTERQCFRQCQKRKRCKIASYDTEEKICRLFKGCEDGFEHDQEGFVTAGRTDKRDYFVTPGGSYCLDCPMIGDSGSLKNVKTLRRCLKKCDRTPECKVVTYVATKKRCRLFSGGKELFLGNGPDRFTAKKKEPTTE